MCDLADQSDARIELATTAGIDAARRALRQRALVPTGFCHWCNETLARSDALYCDGDCAADHAADQRRQTGKSL